MRAINTAEEMLAAFEGNQFDLEKWKRYMDASVPGAKAMCLGDMQNCLSAGFSWEKDYLPVLNAVRKNGEKRMEAVESFRAVAEHLDEAILGRFGRTVDADVVLYLGLCNGAGWVADVGGRTAILLGIEKIMELDWCGRDAMIGLIVHELGHAYQSQYGTARGECREHAVHVLRFVLAGLHFQQIQARILAAVAAHFPFIDQLHRVRTRSFTIHSDFSPIF